MARLTDFHRQQEGTASGDAPPLGSQAGGAARLGAPGAGDVAAGAVRRRPVEIIFLRPRLNTRSSKKLNRSAQSDE
jgi:hypothetical protein